jgi:hypothetical protein
VSKQNQKLTVGSRSGTLLGSTSHLLASSGALLHGHLHASSGFSFGNEGLGRLLENASAVLDGVVGLVEVTGNGCVVDLKKMISMVKITFGEAGGRESLNLPPLEAMRAATRRSMFSSDFQSVGTMMDGSRCCCGMDMW